MAERRRSSLLLLFLSTMPALACAGSGGAQQAQAIDRGPGFVPPNPPPPLIRLVRSGAQTCRAACPTYSVDVDVNGGVTYSGVLKVKTIGRATGSMTEEDMQQLRTLLGKARQARFKTEGCACGCEKDASTVTLTTWDKGVPKTVAYEEGCERVPHAVRVLEDGVDDLVGIERWIGTIQQRRLCFEEQRDCGGFGTPEPVAPDGGR